MTKLESSLKFRRIIGIVENAVNSKVSFLIEQGDT